MDTKALRYCLLDEIKAVKFSGPHHRALNIPNHRYPEDMRMFKHFEYIYGYDARDVSVLGPPYDSIKPYLKSLK